MHAAMGSAPVRPAIRLAIVASTLLHSSGAHSAPLTRHDGAETTPEEQQALQQALASDSRTIAAQGRGDANAPGARGSRDVPPSQTTAGTGNMNPDISLVLAVTGAVFDGTPDPAGAHDPRVTGFNFQQLELAIGSNVDPYFRFDATAAITPTGVELEEAFGRTLALPGGLQARAGQFLTRFGRINDRHPHAWSFVGRPLVLGKMLGPEGSRGIGVELSWLAPLPWFTEVLASTTGAGGSCCARSFFGSDDLGVNRPSDLLLTTAVKQYFDLTDNLGVLAGVSAQRGPNATGPGNRTDIVGGDLTIRYRPRTSANRSSLTFTAELLGRRRQVPGSVLRDWGWYGELVWRATPRWSTGVRYDFVSGAEDDYLDPEQHGPRHRSSVQGTFEPSHFSKVRLQLNHDRATWRPEGTWAAMLAMELTVGAHGAHRF